MTMFKTSRPEHNQKQFQLKHECVGAHAQAHAHKCARVRYYFILSSNMRIKSVN